MSEVDKYSCSLLKRRTEPHGSTVFLFYNVPRLPTPKLSNKGEALMFN